MTEPKHPPDPGDRIIVGKLVPRLKEFRKRIRQHEYNCLLCQQLRLRAELALSKVRGRLGNTGELEKYVLRLKGFSGCATWRYLTSLKQKAEGTYRKPERTAHP